MKEIDWFKISMSRKNGESSSDEAVTAHSPFPPRLVSTGMIQFRFSLLPRFESFHCSIEDDEYIDLATAQRLQEEHQKCVVQ